MMLLCPAATWLRGSSIFTVSGARSNTRNLSGGNGQNPGKALYLKEKENFNQSGNGV